MNAGCPHRPLPPVQIFRVIAKELLTQSYRCVLNRFRRDEIWVTQEYDGGHWKGILERKEWTRYARLDEYLNPPDPTVRIAKLDNRLVWVKTSDYYRFSQNAVRSVLKDYAEGGEELVELGCGAGKNVFALSLAGRWPRLAGLDIAENAIRAARQVAQHFNLSGVRFAPIDLTHPRHAGFRELQGRTVFTYYCLEQLKYDTSKVIDNLIRSGVKRVIHIEPTTELLHLWHPLDLISYLYIVRYDYQDKLIRSLRSFERKKMLEITALKRLYNAPAPRHDPVLVCWEPRGRS